jgi:hypothetical protein
LERSTNLSATARFTGVATNLPGQPGPTPCTDTDALSYLKVDTITLAEGGSRLAVEFCAVSNQTYTVQYRSAVESGAWNRLADVTAASTNRVVTLRDPAVGTFPQRVYRLATPRVP